MAKTTIVVKLVEGKMEYVRNYTTGEHFRPGEIAFEVEDIAQLNDHNSRIRKKTPRNIIKHAIEDVEEWNWSLLSSDQMTQAKDWYESKSFSKLFKLHNTMKLTTQHYCCSTYERHIKINFEKYLPHVEL